MAIKLADFKVGMTDKVHAQVIDTFLRNSEVLQLLPFDNCMSSSGGSTLTYAYVQTKSPSATAFRALNEEYTPSEAKTEKKTADLKILGGSFEIDRVLNDARGQYDNLAFQIEEKVKSAVGTFHNAMINGDSASNGSFDGLDKFLVGQTTEFGTAKVIDLSTTAKLEANAAEFYEALLTLINRTKAEALFVNELMKTKIQTVARTLGYKTETEEAFGKIVTTIGEGKVRLIDLENTVNTSGVETPIIPNNKARLSNTGLTDIYAVHFSVQDGFHGVTLTGTSGVTQYLPDFNQPGAVKKGEVEMVACVALKNVKSAGVLRNIKII